MTQTNLDRWKVSSENWKLKCEVERLSLALEKQTNLNIELSSQNEEALARNWELTCEVKRLSIYRAMLHDAFASLTHMIFKWEQGYEVETSLVWMRCWLRKLRAALKKDDWLYTV